MTRKSKRELEHTLDQLSTAEDIGDMTTDELTMTLLRAAHGHDAALTDEQRETLEKEWHDRVGRPSRREP
jgi:replicative superfamily II helicase